MPLKILILGKGQLGQALSAYFKAKPQWQVSFAGHNEADIKDIASLERLIDKEKPDIILNTAALTNLDFCEENPLETFSINTLGADNVGAVCQKRNIYLVHISSGCIQESLSADEAHSEDDPPNPISFYAWTKVWAEQLLLGRAAHRGKSSDLPSPLRLLILRPRQLLGTTVSHRNTLAKMLTYTKFVDTPNSCTVIEDLLQAAEKLIIKNANGVFNVVNPGITTPYEIALMLKKVIKPDMAVQKISKQELNQMTKAKRIDSVLKTDKLASYGINVPEIHERLSKIIQELKDNLALNKTPEILNQIAQETKNKLLS